MSQSSIAFQFAYKAHDGQFRRDNDTPYINHPEDVATRVMSLGDDYMAVAWLHDVLEDTNYSVSDMQDVGIKPHIIEAVKLLTKDGSLSYEEYLAAIATNPLAKAVKIADMLSNLADNPTNKQIHKYCKGLLFLVDI